jgi:SAM-dependent methyltransferase
MDEDPFAEAGYLPLPELSPYIGEGRYERPKEVFKHIARKLEAITEPGRAYRYTDVACANGELLYQLRQRFPHWRFSGYDLTPAFIEAGRAFPGLDGVDLEVADLFDLEGTFDVVSMINLMTVFWDPRPPLEKLLGLVADGGILLVDGCFNVYDVEVRAVFMDNSTPASAGRWRRDLSQHSRASIAEILEGRCQRFEFEGVPMGVELPRHEGAPHGNVWTFKDEHGRNVITNGTRMMMEKSLLTVWK